MITLTTRWQGLRRHYLVSIGTRIDLNTCNEIQARQRLQALQYRATELRRLFFKSHTAGENTWGFRA